MSQSVCVINGHPDPSAGRLVHALADAYQAGAVEAGLRTSRIDIGRIDFGYLSSAARMETDPPEAIAEARVKLAQADHVAIFFPLWLGGMPAKCRGFFEWAACGGFFLEPGDKPESWPKKLMSGRSARVVVTMGMPGIVYKTLFGSHSLKGFEQGLLAMAGFKPIRHTVIGGVGAARPATRERWLTRMHGLGETAS